VDLQQLRKQAKDLVRAAREGDETALARLGGREVQLARAQLVVARENGYASWPKLVAAAEAGAEAFVLAATDRRPGRARAYLEARPDLLADPWARLVAGRGWDGDVRQPGGPRDWPPLVYVAHSALTDAGAVRELLARGADPNVPGPAEYGPASALYGAAGVVHDPDKTRVLLEAGADPDDGESLYHATEVPDTTCLRLLLEHGAETRGTNALAHALDYEPLETVRLLLEHGADPDEGALIAHAVRRGRGPDAVRLLAEHGGDVSRPGGETWRGDVPLRTPYQHAVLRSRDDVAEALRELGADTTVAPEDLAVASLDPAGLPAAFDVDQQEVLILAALRGRLDAVVDAVGVGFSGVVGGSPEGSLLHHAAWVGEPAVVRGLIDRGADARGVLDWAAHGSASHEADHVAVAELLAAAGDTPTAEQAEQAEGPLRDWLSERT
jgi:ankyrin repeat protein